MTISVTQLNNYIHGIVDIDGVLSDLSVCGEVTNVKRSRDGWYFSLKDDACAIDCFCYANGTEPVGGTMAVAEGRVSYYTKSGRVSLFVRRLTATNNLGAAYARFAELRDRLAKEGLFDEARKKAVPKCCINIGVVTSETGAVIHDIENVALRRQPFSNILLYPVKVQGAGAAEEIVHGLQYLSSCAVDVVILARGGGSNEDLSVFNDERVVRCLANCPKPTISAIGHGVDFTLADFAADRRAVTPSEAAEFVTIDARATKSRVAVLLEKQYRTLFYKLEHASKLVCDNVRFIADGAAKSVDGAAVQTTECLRRISTASERRLTEATVRAEKAVLRISAANPLNVLGRGYAYVEKDGIKIKSAAQLNVGDVVAVKLAEGEASAEIKAVKK